MMEPLVLTFDIGTQSARGMLVNKNGEIVAFLQSIYKEPYFSKAKDWAEQNPDFYYDTICKISKSLKKKYPEYFKRIIGVTTAVFRDSTICLDENNEPLRDMILWLDKREIESSEVPIPKYKQILFKILNVYEMADMQHRQSVCNYIMSREQEIWNKTKKYVVLPTYLNYKLTGNLIDSTANQIAHIPFDYKHSKWQGKFAFSRCIYNVPKEKLCDLCNPGDELGTITNKCSKDTGIKEGTPVIATGSDKGCETIGLSVISKSKAAISFGTSATIQFTTPDYFEPQPYCPSYPSPAKGLFNPEYQIYRGYWMLTWFKNNFVKEEEIKEANRRGISIEEYFNEFLDTVPAGCDGLFLEPYWSPGVTNPNAKGSIIGFSDVQNKYYIYRAIIEGINYGLMYGLETMSKRGGQDIRDIYVGGGGSKSDEICQITADMLGLPIKRIQTNEACGLGSSIIAFVTLGVYKDVNEAINKMTRVSSVFEPNEKNHKLYLNLYKKVYKTLGKKHEKYYKTVKKILND